MRVFQKRFLALGIGLAVMALFGGPAFAQMYPGGGGGTGTGTGSTPSYGHGTAIGIGVGAAAGAGVLFLALHNHGTMTGCVQQTDDGLKLVDDKHNKSYSIETGSVPLPAGERVALKGRKSKSASGEETFEATKLTKDLGSCNVQTAQK